MDKNLLSHSNAISSSEPKKKKTGKMKTLFAAAMALGAATFAGMGEKNSTSSQTSETDNSAKVTHVQEDSIKKTENSNATQFLNACPWCAHIPENSPLWDLNNLPDDATWNKMSDSQKKEFLVYANIASATLFQAGRNANGLELSDGKLPPNSSTKKNIQIGPIHCTMLALESLNDYIIEQNTLNEANNWIYRAQLWQKVGQALENAENGILGSYEVTMRMKRLEIERFLTAKNANEGGVDYLSLLNSQNYDWAGQMLPKPKTIDFPSVVKNAGKTIQNNIVQNKIMMNKNQKGG